MGWGNENCSNGSGHMTNMATMPIYGKNLKNLLLWNKKANDLESWYVASGARVLPSLFKLSRWVDSDLFYGKVKGPGLIRGYFGLRFSENLKFLNSCILHSHNKGNMS